MKKLVVNFSHVFILLVVLVSCSNEEDSLPTLGKANFSLSRKARDNGRVNEAVVPAFVLLSVRDSKGISKENIKLSLVVFGQSYISENLELKTGTYQLIQFAVLDAGNKVIYATPLEGSDLEKHVTNPLPLDFTIDENQNTQVIPEVVAVSSEDTPESFGLASFSFEVVERGVGLKLNLKYPDLESYDSAYIVFVNSTAVIKHRLTLDAKNSIATGQVPVPPGDWKISASYFSTISKNYLSFEKSVVANVKITPTATDLTSDETGVFVKDASGPAVNTFNKVNYYYYQLYLNQKKEGFARLPEDPANPFVQISTFQLKWGYAYADRSFYNSSLDGSSNFLVDDGAFEVYGRSGDTHDQLERNIIDVTSLEPVISRVRSKVWNSVDCIIIISGSGVNDEILLFHRWDLRTSSSGGRMESSLGSVQFSNAEINNRRRMTLNH